MHPRDFRRLHENEMPRAHAPTEPRVPLHCISILDSRSKRSQLKTRGVTSRHRHSRETKTGRPCPEFEQLVCPCITSVSQRQEPAKSKSRESRVEINIQNSSSPVLKLRTASRFSVEAQHKPEAPADLRGIKDEA